jgi:hypothetical protein
MPFSARQVQDDLTVVQALEVINAGVIVLDARVDVVHVDALDGVDIAGTPSLWLLATSHDAESGMETPDFL